MQAMSEVETADVPVVPAKRGRGRPKKAVAEVQVQVEDGGEAGIEDEAEKVPAVKVSLASFCAGICLLAQLC